MTKAALPWRSGQWCRRRARTPWNRHSSARRGKYKIIPSLLNYDFLKTFGCLAQQDSHSTKSPCEILSYQLRTQKLRFHVKHQVELCSPSTRKQIRGAGISLVGSSGILINSLGMNEGFWLCLMTVQEPWKGRWDTNQRYRDLQVNWSAPRKNSQELAKPQPFPKDSLSTA